MKRTLSLIMSVILAIGLAPAPAGAAETLQAGLPESATTATFPDGRLYAAVVGQLTSQRASGGPAFTAEQESQTIAFHAGEAAKVTSLNLSNFDIEDLTGLEAFTDLVELDLSHNAVSDIGKIAGLTKLEHLDLYDNFVHDFSGLAGLSGLEYLNLGDNNEMAQGPLAGLEALNGLTALTYLDFSRNYCPGITAHLAKMADLEFLNLQLNKIEDISVFQNADNLDDVRARFPKLKTLILCDNRIAGTAALANTASLEKLDLQNNQLYQDGYGADQSGVDALFGEDGDPTRARLRLPNLKKLDLYGNWNWNGFLSGESAVPTKELYDLSVAGGFEFGFSYDRVKGFDTSALPHTDAETGVKYVTYDDFGAYCDGRRDDFNAMRNAHRFANANGCEVRATPGKTYHIFRLYDTQYYFAYTNVDWQGATFVVHDEEIDGHASRFSPLLCLRPSGQGATEQTAAYRDIVTLESPAWTVGKHTTSLAAELKDQIDALNAKGYNRYYVMVYNADKQQYKRFGINSSSDQWDGFIVDAKGQLEGPVQWDFDHLTKVVITPVPASKSYVRNGRFVSAPLKSKTETPYSRPGGKPIYHLRNLQIRECANIEISGITQTVGTEEGGYDNDELSGSTSGFFSVSNCADVEMRNCAAWARRYDEGGRSTYGISLNSNVNISLVDVNCSNPWEQLLEEGGRRWGVTGTNHNKHILFDHCTLNRIDAHEGFYDMTARDCTLGNWAFRLTGQGPLTIERCDVYADTFITLRTDYGSTWDGDARIIDCTHHYYRRDSGSQNLIATTMCFDDADKTKPHDFGYELHHPNLHVENLTVDEAYFAVREGDWLPFRTVYGILSNFEHSNADRWPASYWPDTVEIEGLHFVNYEKTISYEPHVRMPVNEAGPVMEKTGNYRLSNVTYNGVAVAADVMDGDQLPGLLERTGAKDVPSLPAGIAASGNSSRQVFHSFTEDVLGARDVLVEYSGTTPTLALVDASWQGWMEISPYYIDRGAQTNVAYYSNRELTARWKESSSKGAGPFAILEPRTTGETHLEHIALADAYEPHQHAWGEWRQTVDPTCTTEGSLEQTCSINERHIESKQVAALGHSWDAGNVTVAPTQTAEGVRTFTCTRCGQTRTERIAKLAAEASGTASAPVDIAFANVKLSKAAFAYDGKAKAPTVSVFLGGRALEAGRDYAVSYAGGRKNVGAHLVTVIGVGAFAGSRSATFRIVPKATGLTSLAPGKRQFKAAWKARRKQVDGYQLQYAAKAGFAAGAKKVKVAKAKAASCTVRGLASGKAYWVRVRTYKAVGKANYCSAWSKPRKVRVR